MAGGCTPEKVLLALCAVLSVVAAIFVALQPQHSGQQQDREHPTPRVASSEPTSAEEGQVPVIEADAFLKTFSKRWKGPLLDAPFVFRYTNYIEDFQPARWSLQDLRKEVKRWESKRQIQGERQRRNLGVPAERSAATVVHACPCLVPSLRSALLRSTLLWSGLLWSTLVCSGLLCSTVPYFIQSRYWLQPRKASRSATISSCSLSLSLSLPPSLSLSPSLSVSLSLSPLSDPPTRLSLPPPPPPASTTLSHTHTKARSP